LKFNTNIREHLFSQNDIIK